MLPVAHLADQVGDGISEGVMYRDIVGRTIGGRLEVVVFTEEDPPEPLDPFFAGHVWPDMIGTEFRAGDTSPGCHFLALAILLECGGDPKQARLFAGRFVLDVLSKLTSEPWGVDSTCVGYWRDGRETADLNARALLEFGQKPERWEQYFEE